VIASAAATEERGGRAFPRCACGVSSARALGPIAAVFGLFLAQALCAQAPAPRPGLEPTPSPAPALLVNERRPLPGILTGGAPAGEAGFQGLAGAGVRTLIDLRSDDEVDARIRSEAEAAGLVYERIPVRGDADLGLGSARALDALLDEQARYPVAIVCASGNRVGALLAVRAFWLQGTPATVALALGRAAGLTRLEPSVRSLLGLPPAPSATPSPKPTPSRQN